MHVGILTVSDRVSASEMEDRGGAAVVDVLRSAFPDIEITSGTVPDVRDEISELLTRWADLDNVDAIITTGGTGIAARDVTPEATLDVVSVRVPGVEEGLRARGLEKLPAAMLSRGIAGIRGRTFIVNLPGSPSGAAEGAQILTTILPHVIDLLHGRTRHEDTSDSKGSANS